MISEFSTFVFDCDGVILDSNRVKTDAFRTAARFYSEAAADALVAYHVSNGGISRYEKFRYFIDEILPNFPASDAGMSLEGLLKDYADAVRDGLMSCAIAPGLAQLRILTSGTRWLIVSGGDQRELNDIFVARGIASYFDGGIFGSPDNKDIILTRELETGNIERPALFLGDSRYDHVAAMRAGIDFLFVSNWSEMPDWPNYLSREGIRSIPGVQDLLSSF
ncbi:MAG: HAD family hydrolase [Sphingobium sp.]